MYGTTTLSDVCALIDSEAHAYQVTVCHRQSNFEGQLIEWVHEAADAGIPVIINPGGFTHTSVALRDALAEIADGAGFVEVHISNIHAREEFRHHSFLSPIARGVIAGLEFTGTSLHSVTLLGHPSASCSSPRIGAAFLHSDP